jgi:hypothetical protein
MLLSHLAHQHLFAREYLRALARGHDNWVALDGEVALPEDAQDPVSDRPDTYDTNTICH